jgi:hypothetical protein
LINEQNRGRGALENNGFLEKSPEWGSAMSRVTRGQLRIARWRRMGAAQVLDELHWGKQLETEKCAAD